MRSRDATRAGSATSFPDMITESELPPIEYRNVNHGTTIISKTPRKTNGRANH